MSKNPNKELLALVEKSALEAKTSADEAKKAKEEADKSAQLAAKLLEAIAASSSALVEKQQKKSTAAAGKPLDDYLEDYAYYTGKASDINRSLALAGVAIIWLFRNTGDGQPLFPLSLLHPLFFLVVSLGLDLMQYFFGSASWGIFYEYNFWRRKKKKISEEKAADLEAPNALSVPITLLFFAKIVCMTIAYIELFLFLKSKIAV